MEFARGSKVRGSAGNDGDPVCLVLMNLCDLDTPSYCDQFSFRHDLVPYCWERLTEGPMAGALTEEGLLLEVLLYAGRIADVRLAEDAFLRLEKVRVRDRDEPLRRRPAKHPGPPTLRVCAVSSR